MKENLKKTRHNFLEVIIRYLYQFLFDSIRAAYEEEILEKIIIPLFSNIHQENETAVRTNVGKLLIDFVSHCDTKRSLELLDIIEKMFNRPFDKFMDESKIVLKNENELQHISIIVDELIRVSVFDLCSTRGKKAKIITLKILFQVFVLKLYHLPASHAIKIFHILNGHLEKYYQKPLLLDSSVLIRKKIFTWMLKARANATYHFGYPDEKKNGAVRFSHYLSIDVNELVNRSNQSIGITQTSQKPQPQQQQLQQQPQQQQIPAIAGSQQQSQESHLPLETTISIRRSCKIIIECLKTENDWSIMQLLLKELPNVLQNKALLRGIDMDTLATSVISLVNI